MTPRGRGADGRKTNEVRTAAREFISGTGPRRVHEDVRTGINATGLYWETLNGPVVLFYTGRHHACRQGRLVGAREITAHDASYLRGQR
jgi:hypothetical protein